MMTTKTCTVCGETKPLAEFHKNASSPDGHRTWCKPCVTAYRKEYREANKKRVAAKEKEWYEDNKERAAARNKKWHKANKERTAARNKKWRKANKERVAARIRAYYAAKDNRIPPWAKEITKEADIRFRKWANWYTENTGIRHDVDHQVPLQGEFVSGLHVPWNMQVLDGPTNWGKCNQWGPEWDSEAWEYDPATVAELRAYSVGANNPGAAARPPRLYNISLTSGNG